MPKTAHASQAKVLTDIPNIGKSIAQNLRDLGVTTPAQVAAMDSIAMYEALQKMPLSVVSHTGEYLVLC